MNALLFSQHADEASVFQVILQQAGFMVRASRSLDQAIENWPDQPADLVFIALSDQHTKSIHQIKQMRAHTAVPIVVVTDLIPDDLLVNFLEVGADLVILRPYSVRFLLAQIKAVMRRGAGVPFFSLPTLNQRDVILDPASRTVQVGKQNPKHLTQLEFRLLYTLMTHVGQIIPTEQIVEYVWGYTGDGNRELVRGLVQRLRSKVETTPRTPQYIITEPGIGYSFRKFDP